MSVEIELRARITAEQFAALKHELEDVAGPARIQARCFIDYSTFLEGIGERRLDVRIRVTNGITEIAVKRGQFGGAVREEAVAKVAPSDLENVLSVMALLGYVKGVAGGRRIFRGNIGDVELALQEVLDFSDPERVGERFLEVEFIGTSNDSTTGEAALRSFLAAHNISPFSAEEWNAYVKSLNDRWNGVYIHGETSPDTIRALGSD
jgi:hypothetical protein